MKANVHDGGWSQAAVKEVWLNNDLQRNCIWADEEKGEAEIYVTVDGKIVYDPDGDCAKTIVVQGKVRFVLNKDWYWIDNRFQHRPEGYSPHPIRTRTR